MSFDYYKLIRPLLFALPAEAAHHAAIFALKNGLLPAPRVLPQPMLAARAFGLSFDNPIGLAAGFDKHGEAADALTAQGFGFVEAGTVTSRPQPGNEKPRLFRLKEDEAVINRFGFNSKGADYFAHEIAKRKQGIVGINIGRNKETEDAVGDYVRLLEKFAPLADYVTVNISSPNTQGLRDLQRGDALEQLLSTLAGVERRVPLLLKIAPDLGEGELENLVEAVLKFSFDGLIVSNTTLARPDSLKSALKAESGGLSGRPLMASSTGMLKRAYRLTQGKIPLIGVGGIASTEDAYAKIRAGATLVQLYSALVYQGFGLVARIRRELPVLLTRDGFSHVSEAVGVDA